MLKRLVLLMLMLVLAGSSTCDLCILLFLPSKLALRTSQYLYLDHHNLLMRRRNFNS